MGGDTGDGIGILFGIYLLGVIIAELIIGVIYVIEFGIVKFLFFGCISVTLMAFFWPILLITRLLNI